MNDAPENGPGTPLTEGARFGRYRRPLLVVAGFLAFWLVTSLVLAPALLGGVEPGSAMADFLADWHARWWDGVVILLAFAAVVPGFIALRHPHEARIPAATAEALGATRMLIAAILLANVLWEDLPSTAFLPRGMLDLDRMLIGTLHSLPIGFDLFLASPGALFVFELTTAALLALATVGLFTRWTVPAATLAYLLFAAVLRSYAWTYHMGLVPLYALLLLSFTPCGDAWSLDRWRRRRAGVPVVPAREPRLRYSIGRYLVWMAIALPYTMAGLSKIRKSGLLWWQGEHMKQMLVGTIVEPMHFTFELTYRMLGWPDVFWDALGLAALAGEVLFVLVLVSRVARWILPLATAVMHVGILLMQNIFFPDLIAIQAVFYDWSGLRDRLARRWPAARQQPARVSATAAGGPRAARIAGVARWFLVLSFITWATRTEKFPFTAMQMFSSPQPLTAVEYVRPAVMYADGSRKQARFEQWIGAMADTRYRRIIRWDRHPERIPLLREFLDSAARRADSAGAPGARIEQFELELRRWDFRRHPDDPDRGEVIGVFRHRPGE